jgi:hypothetical protein
MKLILSVSAIILAATVTQAARLSVPVNHTNDAAAHDIPASEVFDVKELEAKLK